MKLIKQLYALVTLGMLLSVSMAQDLNALLPESTIATLGISRDALPEGTFWSDLEALEWTQAKEVLLNTVGLFASMDNADEEILIPLHMMLDGSADVREAMAEEINEFCPEFASLEALSADYEAPAAYEAVAAVSIEGFNPIPAVTALLRVDDASAAYYTQVRDVMLGCAELDGMEITRLEQDGVPLFVVNDGGDLPVVIANAGNVFMAGTNPNELRAVIRKLNGSNEAGFAGSALATQLTDMQASNALSVSVDFAALAAVLDPYSDFIVRDDESAYLVERGLAALRTLGGFAGTLAITDEGFVSEQSLLVNPDGGDDALAALLLCETCQVTEVFLAPEGSVEVSGQYLPWRELFVYAQGWLDGMSKLTETTQEFDIKTLVMDEFGLDLDTALFNWLGSDIYSVRIEALGSSLQSLLYETQAVIIPVSSVEAAEAGLAELAAFIEPFQNELISEFDLMNEFGPLIGSPLAGSQLAIREYDYSGVRVKQFQSGFNNNFGLAFVGNHLVITSPASAMESIIDTYQGARNLQSDRQYRAAKTLRPEQVSSFMYSDVKTSNAVLADTLEVLSQPLAYFVNSMIQLSQYDPYAGYDWDDDYGWDDDYDWDDSGWDDEIYGYADLYNIFADVLPVGTTVTNELSFDTDTVNNYNELADYYELTGLNAGDIISVSVISEEFDTYLQLINADTEVVVAYNDEAYDVNDYAGMRSEITYEVKENQTLWIEVSSYSTVDEGTYTLALDYGDAANITMPSADSYYGLGDADINGIEASEIAGDSVIEGNLDLATDVDNYGEISDYYVLTGFNVGDEVTVSLNSNAFDTYLYLIDASSNVYLDANDDAPDSSRSELTFTVTEGMTPWIVVTSYYSTYEEGPYTLNVSSTSGYIDGSDLLNDPEIAEEASDAVHDVEDANDETMEMQQDDSADVDLKSFETPTFADLLNVTDLLPAYVRVISEHSSFMEGFTTVRDGAVYSRTVWHMNW